MRLFSFLILILGVSLIAACSHESFFPSEPASKSTSVPLVTEVTKPPLQMTFDSITYSGGKASIHFIAEHIDKSKISADDYQFQWPTYVSDNIGVMYEIEKATINKTIMQKQELETHQLGVTLNLATPLSSDESVSLHVPLYLTPILFKEGYPFQVSDENKVRTKVGDFVVENIQIEEAKLSFTLNDETKDQIDPPQAYLFSQVSDNQSIYPLFSNLQQNEHSLEVELEFAHSITYPARFLIETSTLNIPEWRFSFVVPLTRNDDS